MHRRLPRAWDRPSARVRELIRAGAELISSAPPEWIEDIQHATLADARPLEDDPALAASVRRAVRANMMHWAAANVRDPGAAVPPNLGPETLDIARDLVRRGLDVWALQSYRNGQNAAWLSWMKLAFALTQDAGELEELLDVTARSIASFVDATMAGVAAQMEVEREELTRGTHAERREVVALLLEGAPVRISSASRRLGYTLEATHRAAIVWSEQAERDRGALEEAAECLTRQLGSGHPLAIIASASTLWVWIASDAEPDIDRLGAALYRSPDVRVAIGSKGRGVEGFRRSHLDALTTQRMVARSGGHPQVASFDMIRLVALVTQDLEAANAFITHTLGDLASAPEELQRALRVFFEEGCNAAHAAIRLRTHRNTLLRRLSRAQELLPRPLAENRLHVAVALDVLRWRTRAARPPSDGDP